VPYCGFTIYEQSDKWIPGNIVFNWECKSQNYLYFLFTIQVFEPFLIYITYYVYGFESESFNKVCFTHISTFETNDLLLSFYNFFRFSGPIIQIFKCCGKIVGTKNLVQFWHCMHDEFLKHLLNYFNFFYFYSAC
jgi:hypothetical protein